MANVFINLANFAPHTFFTLAPPSTYLLNQKTLTKVSKVNWSSQLSYKILWFSFERKFSKDKLHFFTTHSFTNFSLREEEHLFIGILICTCLDHHDLTEFSFDRSIWGCPQPQCVAFCFDSVTSLVEFHIAEY